MSQQPPTDLIWFPVPLGGSGTQVGLPISLVVLVASVVVLAVAAIAIALIGMAIWCGRSIQPRIRYRLRTLVILTLVIPPVFAAVCLGGGSIVFALAVYLGLVVLAKRIVFSDRPRFHHA